MADVQQEGPAAEPAGGMRVQLTAAEWLLLLVLGAVQFTHIVDFMIVMPLGPQYLRELDINTQQFGLLVAAYGFSASLAGLLAVWFIDRFDRKTALLALYAGFTAGTFLCAVAPGFGLLLLARTVTGGFGGVAASCVLAIVGDAFPYERRGTAMGVVMSAFSVASIVGVPAGLYLANNLGWRAPFTVLGVVSLAVLALGQAVLPSLRGHLAGGHGLRQASTWAVLTRPAHLRAYSLTIALVFSSILIAPYLAVYLVANVGRTDRELPYVYLCGGLATLLTLPPIGRLADRFGKLPIFRIMALATVVPILVLTNMPPVSLATALAATTLFMIVSAGRMVPAMALLTASARAQERGRFLSVNASVQQLAMGLAAVVGGRLLGETRSGVPLTGYDTLGWLAAGAGVLSVVLAGRLRRAEDEPAEPAGEGAGLVAAPDAPALEAGEAR
jgi:predicted MFS family arabinose efflux permease